jgi:hypothetical protein
VYVSYLGSGLLNAQLPANATAIIAPVRLHYLDRRHVMQRTSKKDYILNATTPSESTSRYLNHFILSCSVIINRANSLLPLGF